MAGIKIVDLPPLGRDLASTDLLELSLAGGTGSRKITGQEIMNASKLSINNTPIINGTVGRVLFQGTGDVLQQSSSLFWDATNNCLGIGTSSPTSAVDIRTTTAQPILINTSSNIEVAQFFGTATSGLPAVNYAGFRIIASTNGVPYIGLNTSANAASNVVGTQRAFIAYWGDDFGFGSVGYLNDTHAIAWSTTTGNVKIGGVSNGKSTFTDAGFRLDVNGTARVSETITSNLSSANWDLGTYNILDLQRNGSSRATLKSNGTFSWTSGTDLTINSGGGTARTVLSSVNSEILAVANQAGIDYNARFSQRAGKIAVRVLGISGTTQNLFEVLTGASVNAFNIFSTGNVGINTTTDAGFRLDVNGIGRFGVNASSSSVTIGQTAVNTGYIINATGYASSQYAYRFNNINGGTALFGGNNQQVIHRLDGGYQGSTTLQINGSSTISGTSYLTSSILELNSTIQGFLPPRMTTTQKNAIATPAAGLMVYDTTLNKLCVYTTAWETVTSL